MKLQTVGEGQLPDRAARLHQVGRRRDRASGRRSARSSTTSARTADVVVIGGGALGAATAFHLRRLGVDDVVLLERDALASGSTSKSAGGIRAQFADELNIRIALRSLRRVRGARRRDLVPAARLPVPARPTRTTSARFREALAAAAVARRAVARADAGGGARDRAAARSRRPARARRTARATATRRRRRSCSTTRGVGRRRRAGLRGDRHRGA